MKDRILNNKNLPLFVKKIYILYISYVKWNITLSIKSAAFLTYFWSKTPYYYVYILLSVLAVCDQKYSSWWNLWILYAVLFIFSLPIYITFFYNNKWFSPKIEYLVGEDFSEKYLKRNKSGVFIKPLLLLSLACLTPFFVDLLTCAIDGYEQVAQMNVLREKMDRLHLLGKTEEGKNVFNQFSALAKMPSKGIITKINIILQSVVQL